MTEQQVIKGNSILRKLDKIEASKKQIESIEFNPHDLLDFDQNLTLKEKVRSLVDETYSQLETTLKMELEKL